MGAREIVILARLQDNARPMTNAEVCGITQNGVVMQTVRPYAGSLTKERPWTHVPKA